MKRGADEADFVVGDERQASRRTADAKNQPNVQGDGRMKLADFLSVIWPNQGWYCVAQPKKTGDRRWWAQSSYPTRAEAIEKLLTVGQLSDVYFTVLSLREPYIIDQNKIDKAVADGRQITEYTGRSYRVHSNMAWGRSFFIDIDVGKPDAYATQADAIEALQGFCKKVGLPRPWIVISGVGFHVYWPLAEDVPAVAWRVVASKLKALCAHHELKADPTRTADVTSVLRPPGTYHFKNPKDPKRVFVVKDGPVTTFEELQRIIDRAHQLVPTGTTHEGEPLTSTASPVSLSQLRKACPLADEMIDAPEKQSEPRWYKLLGLVMFTESGAQACHKVSEGHPGYTAEETDAKLDQLNRKMPDGSTLGPTTCKSMAETCGPEHCGSCWFSKTAFYKEGSSSPIVAARRLPLDNADASGIDDFYAYMPMHQYIFAPTCELWPAASVDARVPPKAIQTPANGQDNFIRASRWLDQNKPVEQMTWAPGEPQLIKHRLAREGQLINHEGASCFNLYRPPMPRPGGDAACAERWVAHIEKVYPDDAEHIIRYLAHRVQHPGIKINHALVLGGAQGIGKDTILAPVREAIGTWNFQDVSPQMLLGRFTGFVRGVILRVSEARDLGEQNRFQFYDHMKTYTASPPETLRVDEKHLREYYVHNCCSVIITTNHKTDGIYLPADDRRHYVAWSTCSKDDFSEGYWQQLWDWYASGGYAHVAAYLTAVDLSMFDAKAPPLKTPAFWEIVDANRAPEDAELANVIDRIGSPDAVTLEQIRLASDPVSEFRAWIDERRNRRAVPHRLEKSGYSAVRNTGAADGLWKVGANRVTVYAKTTLSERDRQAAAAAITFAAAKVK